MWLLSTGSYDGDGDAYSCLDLQWMHTWVKRSWSLSQKLLVMLWSSLGRQASQYFQKNFNMYCHWWWMLEPSGHGVGVGWLAIFYLTRDEWTEEGRQDGGEDKSGSGAETRETLRAELHCSWGHPLLFGPLCFLSLDSVSSKHTAKKHPFIPQWTIASYSQCILVAILSNSFTESTPTWNIYSIIWNYLSSLIWLIG